MPTLDDGTTLGVLERGLEHARRAGATGAKIICSHGETITAAFGAGRLKDTGGGQTFGHTVEVLAHQRLSRASGTMLQDVTASVERAVSLLHLGAVAHFDAWPAPAAYTPVPQYAAATARLSRGDLIAACERIAEPLRHYNPDLFISCQAYRSEVRNLLATSGGLLHAHTATAWSLGAFVQRTQDTDILIAHDSRAWGDADAYFEPDAIAAKILQQLRWAEHTVAAPVGRTTVFAPPEVLNLFLVPLYLGINGRTVAKGESPLADKLGHRIIAPCFSISDNPHRPYSTGTAEMDDDGIPTQRQALVTRGVLQKFLYDLDSARLAAAAPTGNSNCAPYYLEMQPGTRPSSELLRGIDDGLYLTENFIGFGQSNMLNGDFACNLGLGYRIEKGEIVGRVKNTMISGNLYELLDGTVELSSDLDFEGSLPSAVIEGVSVSA